MARDTPEWAAHEAARMRARRAAPGRVATEKLATRAKQAALAELRRRHEHEFLIIEAELREALGIPPRRPRGFNWRKDAPTPPPTEPRRAQRCKHVPEKRSYGLYCGLCDTPLN